MVGYQGETEQPRVRAKPAGNGSGRPLPVATPCAPLLADPAPAEPARNPGPKRAHARRIFVRLTAEAYAKMIAYFARAAGGDNDDGADGARPRP
jgi:hypothetical protein